MLVLEDLGGLHATIQVQLFDIIRWDINFDYGVVEWFPLEQTKIILSFLRLHPSTALQSLLLTMRATPILLRDSCPQ